MSVVCYQVEVCTKGRSLVHRSPIECGVSECDRTPRQRGPCPFRAVLTLRRGVRGVFSEFRVPYRMLEGIINTFNAFQSYTAV